MTLKRNLEWKRVLFKHCYWCEKNNPIHLIVQKLNYCTPPLYPAVYIVEGLVLQTIYVLNKEILHFWSVHWSELHFSLYVKLQIQILNWIYPLWYHVLLLWRLWMETPFFILICFRPVISVSSGSLTSQIIACEFRLAKPRSLGTFLVKWLQITIIENHSAVPFMSNFHVLFLEKLQR